MSHLTPIRALLKSRRNTWTVLSPQLSYSVTKSFYLKQKFPKAHFTSSLHSIITFLSLVLQPTRRLKVYVLYYKTVIKHQLTLIQEHMLSKSYVSEHLSWCQICLNGLQSQDLPSLYSLCALFRDITCSLWFLQGNCSCTQNCFN